MRCEDARRRLLAHAWDHEASRHLESCAACFEAMESADPLSHALRGARPDDVPAPAGLADAVLSRRPSGGRLAALWAALVVVSVAAGAALVLLGGAGPGWAAAGVGGIAGALAPVVAVRDILLAQPAVLTVFGAVTLAACALWLRLALRPPVWRMAR
ncbi:MAG: hypothetical protein E6J41_27955 [Chloroflexi bacterium]|nr:MAG: hypothetical protein E6J41_27955 [Chloroflexota bacterium]